MSLVDNVRLEVTFGYPPGLVNPAWTDVSPFLDLTTGVTISAGRADEYTVTQTGTMSGVLDNRDGRFTPGLAGSPYFPNVKVRTRTRVSWRDRAVPGNLLDVESATFEGGTIGLWAIGNIGVGIPTLSNSGARAHSGTKSMLITWDAQPAGQSGTSWASTTPLVVGRTHTFSVWVFVPTGSPAVQLTEVVSGSAGSASTVTNAWQRISLTFLPPAGGFVLPSIVLAAAATAGQQVWVDDIQLDEGAAVATFTTAAPVVIYRHTGYAEEWPTSWPTGGDAYSTSVLSTADRFKLLGKADPLRSVIEQEYLSDLPVWYSTLGAASGAVSAGDISGITRLEATLRQVGAGGTLAFGANTGPPTDGLQAPAFTPVDANNGLYLQATMPAPVGGSDAGLSVEAFFNTTGTAQSTIIRLRNFTNPANSDFFEVGLDSTGHLNAVYASSSVSAVATSAGTFHNGATHHVMATQTASLGTVTMAVIADGVQVASATYTPAVGTVPAYDTIMIGGSNWFGQFFGTIAHAAVYPMLLPTARAVAHSAAGTTGFSGERSDQRIARLARYAGIPPGEQSLEVGMTTSTAFVDFTGVSVLQAMQDVAATENGVLFINPSGQLTFQARSHRYSAASVLTVNAGDVDPGLRFVTNDALMVNDVTATNPAGATSRAVNAQSVSDYGTSAQTLTLLTTSSAEVADAASWKVQLEGAIDPRCPNLTLDLMTSPALVAGALQLGVGSRITLAGLPAQAPSSSVDLFIEGWTETITSVSWVLTLNTSPAFGSAVWVLGDPVYGLLGTTTRLAY